MRGITDKETKAYHSRTRRSASLFEQAKRLTPFGVHSNYRFTDPYPLFCARAKGSRIWDVDGNEYLDFCMGFGALATGHANPTIVRAVSKRIGEGTLFGFETEEAVTLADIITRRFRLELVRFSSTGLEGTLHAFRLARAFTKRKKILKFEGCYHGSHDSALVSVKPTKEKAGDKRTPNQVPASLGLLDEVVKNTLVAPFNDIDAVEEIMAREGENVAGIILEPIPMNMGFVLPKPGFLEGLRRICSERGSLLIFDEVKTCSKFFSGAAGLFKVRPDLMVLGKAIAGGYPLSAVGGKREVMEVIVPGVVSHAGTFNSNPLSLTAGISSLSEVLTSEAMAKCSRLGEELAGAYVDLLKDAGLGARVQWRGMSGTIHFTGGKVENWRDFLKCNLGKWWTYYLSMLNRGVIPMATGPDEQWTVSTMHMREDIERHVEVFKQVVSSLKDSEFEMPLVEAL